MQLRPSGGEGGGGGGDRRIPAPKSIEAAGGMRDEKRKKKKRNARVPFTSFTREKQTADPPLAGDNARQSASRKSLKLRPKLRDALLYFRFHLFDR